MPLKKERSSQNTNKKTKQNLVFLLSTTSLTFIHKSGILLVSTDQPGESEMTKRYLVSELILRKANNQIRKEFGADHGLFWRNGSRAESYGQAEGRLNLLIEALDKEIAIGVPESQAKERVLSAYKSESAQAGRSLKTVRLIEIAFEAVVAEAKEKPSRNIHHRDTRPWWLQQDEKQGA